MTYSNEYYLSRFNYDSRRDGVWAEICRYLQARYIAPDAKILELGAGYCHFINQITASEKHAFDISPDFRRYADSSVNAHVGSCLSLHPIKTNHLGVVFASNLFEHLSRDEIVQTLSEIRRVLHAGGKLLIIQPNFKYCFREYFDDYTHVQVFTHISLANLLVASGFRVLDVKPKFLPFSMKSRFPKLSFLVKLYLWSPIKPFAGQMLIAATVQTKQG